MRTSQVSGKSLATTSTAIHGGNNAMLATDGAVATSKRLEWRIAEVREIVDETPRVRSLILDVPNWPGHKPGQHADIRLTGEDGYQAQRSYSIASAPESDRLSITVERIDDGEVSPYLASEIRPGDRFELRGPIGGYFAWTTDMGGPLFLIAGGSGVAPLMAMLRHRHARASTTPTLLLYSSRTFEDIIYRDELDHLDTDDGGLTVIHTLTRRQPVAWTGGTRRIDRKMLESIGIPPSTTPHIFVCGPTQLVEETARSLLDIGHASQQIRTERFGPTGG
jgi:ferredoxin-NADP reductase